MSLRGSSELPIVDLGSLDEEATARELDQICRDTGFLAIAGHAVRRDSIESTWSAARAFFEMPLEKKMRVAMPFRGYPYGYAPMEAETLALSLGDTASRADCKETFSIGPRPTWRGGSHPDDWDPSLGFEEAVTLWPDEPPELAPAFRRYFDEMGALAARLLSLFALALALPRDFFLPAIDRHASALRALSYPALSAPARPGQLRAGAHTDYGSLSILFAEPGSRGLEIRTRDGQWRAVPIDNGTFVVNVGDLLARWSNDRWVSTMHRVSMVGAEEPRFSLAFFHLPNWDAEIRTLPGCLPPGETPRYPPVRAGDHLMTKFRSALHSVPKENP